MKEVPKAPRRVLVADDDRVIIAILESTLRSHGFEVTAVGNGKQAQELVETTTPPFDLIILDIIMPGMNGLDLCRYVKGQAQLEHTPIIMMTSLTHNSGLADGFWNIGTDGDAFFSKPFDPEAIVRKVNQLIHQAHSDNPTAGAQQPC